MRVGSRRFDESGDASPRDYAPQLATAKHEIKQLQGKLESLQESLKSLKTSTSTRFKEVESDVKSERVYIDRINTDV
jgi:hypothetical protein